MLLVTPPAPGIGEVTTRLLLAEHVCHGRIQAYQRSLLPPKTFRPRGSTQITVAIPAVCAQAHGASLRIPLLNGSCAMCAALIFLLQLLRLRVSDFRFFLRYSVDNLDQIACFRSSPQVTSTGAPRTSPFPAMDVYPGTTQLFRVICSPPPTFLALILKQIIVGTRAA